MKAFKVKRGGETYYRAELPQRLCNDGKRHSVMGKTRHVCGYLKDFLFDPGLVARRGPPPVSPRAAVADHRRWRR